ncbi:MAG: hypothetical protein CVU57_11130 [Deltaproteobacteria bacterium HGW-Deltaproteobacteria-15]|jgi:hypothetical protein|nr:MAG: hypothetical protein CVU57_11130 [Deltaproteobacteria bacterium HGW-Deltaproteobacteria-15]
MWKMIVSISMAALMWVWPGESMAAFQPKTAGELQPYLKQIDLSEVSASTLFSVHVRPGGTFVSGRFGGRGFQKFGNRGGFHKFGNRGFDKFGHKGFYPYKYGGFPAYKYGRYPGYRYGFHPYIYGRDRFNTDRFFSDRYSRFGFSSPYISPFGTRRPGW